jgi:hypothetical protein
MRKSTRNWVLGSIWMLDILRGRFHGLTVCFTLIFPRMSLMIFPPISVINYLPRLGYLTCDWGNLADFGEQEVYGY